jgi:ferritin-like metal-binding protein YciE
LFSAHPFVFLGTLLAFTLGKEKPYVPVETLDELLEESLRDLLDAEKQLTKALPKMAKAATSPELKTAFTAHLEQTRGHHARLEQAMELLGFKARGKACAAMKGLIQEGQEQIEEDADGAIKDLMLITAAQKVEHYEISGYGTVRALAEALGNAEVADLLKQTEDEEGDTDKKLTSIATTLIEEFSYASEDGEVMRAGSKQ